MKYITLFVLPFFLMSCGTDADVPDEDVFEPYQIGTWLVTSAETAEWIGDPSPNKIQSADTTVINTADQRSITLERYDEQRVQVSIVDSVFHTDKTFGDFEFAYEDGPFQPSYGFWAYPVEFEFPMTYKCVDPWNRPRDYLWITAYDYDSPEEILFVYEFHVAGMEETIHELLEC